MEQNGRWEYGRMLGDLEAATRAYRAAQAAAVDAERAVVEAKAEIPRARERLHATIVAAARAGVRQVDLIRVTGYNRESIRRILRAAGVEAE